MPPSGELVAVGRIGPAHGVRGDVFVEPWTDLPEERFVGGSTMVTEPAAAGPLTIESARLHGGRLLVHFTGIDDRDAVTALRGVRLLIAAGDRPALDDPDEFYVTDLIGLTARRADDRAELGPVVDVVNLAGADYLVLDLAGVERLVPFVSAIVTDVDPVDGWVLIDPPVGLFEL